jgi:hypothetical protein
VVKPEANSGVVAPQPTEAAAEEAEPFDAYGDLIPYADPSWYQTVCQPTNHTSASLTRDPVPFSLLQRYARRPARRSPPMGRRQTHAQRDRMGRSEKGAR